jgi:hypothetical protein
MGGPFLPASIRATGLASVFGTRRGVAGAAWRIARAVAIVMATGLAAFHARLLWDRLAAGELFDPEIALRWSGALFLLVALVALHRAGVSLVKGRRALVVWLLVALLHWSAGPTRSDAAAGLPDPSAILLVLPSTAAALLGLGLAIASLTTRRGSSPLLACLCTVGPRATGRLSDGWRRGGLSRAPPHAIA